MCARTLKFFGLGVALALLALAAGNSGQVGAQTSAGTPFRGNGGVITIDPNSPGNWSEVSLWFSSGGQRSRIIQCGSTSCDPFTGTGRGLFIESDTPIWFTSVFAEGGTNVRVWGNFSVSGVKNFVQPHPTDPSKEIAYASLEGPEVGTYIRGTAQLVNGEAVIELPEHFALVTSSEGLTVQLTPTGEWLQLYVVELSPQRLTVREAQRKDGRFFYLVQGVRKGYENYQVIQERGN